MSRNSEERKLNYFNQWLITMIWFRRLMLQYLYFNKIMIF